MEMNKFDTANTQISALADYIETSILKLLTQKKEVCLAVSGGKSPIPLFTELSQRNLDWSKVTVTLVDERFVATTHEDSNEKLVKDNLLKNHASAAKFIGLSNFELGISQSLQLANDKIPLIDLAILGMGEDGHTASIFPCARELSQAINLESDSKNERYLITHPTSANHPRIGLNMAAILSIPKLVLSINGENKLSILEQAINANSSNLPIGMVVNRRPDIQIFWFK